MLEPVRFLFSENINIFLQGFDNSFLYLPLLAISYLFSIPGLMLLASIIFWCFDRKTGIVLMYATIFSAFLAQFAKSFFGLPRPPEYLHRTSANGFGFPSGHSTTSSFFWGYLGLMRKKLWIIIISFTAIVAVSMSRVYLGVHYVGDVIGGIFFGLSIVVISLKAEPGIFRIWKRLDSKSKCFVVIMFPSILLAIAALQSGILREHMEMGMVMLGIGTGHIIEKDHIGFEDTKNNIARIKRFFISILILAVAYFVSNLLFSNLAFFSHAVLGFTSTFIAPFVFTRMETRSGVKR